MKQILLMIAIIGLTGCFPSPPNYNKVKLKNLEDSIEGEVVTIEGITVNRFKFKDGLECVMSYDGINCNWDKIK